MKNDTNEPLYSGPTPSPNRRGNRGRGSVRMRLRRIKRIEKPGRYGLTGPRNVSYEDTVWEWKPTAEPPFKKRSRARTRNKIARKSRKANR